MRSGRSTLDLIRPRMFNMTRIPQSQCDKLHKALPSDPAARQIVVLIQNHMFLVDVYQEGNVFIGLDAMVKQLAACVDNIPATGSAVPVPILTADDRDTWAKVGFEHIGTILSLQLLESKPSQQSFNSKSNSTLKHRFIIILHFTRLDN